jgi:hypothetical protein
MPKPRSPDEWIDRILDSLKDVQWPASVEQATINATQRRIPAVIWAAVYDSFRLGRAEGIADLQSSVTACMDDYARCERESH